jgi:hypothetical protein
MVTCRKVRNSEYIVNVSLPYEDRHACVVSCPRVRPWLLLSGSEWMGNIALSIVIILSYRCQVSGMSLALTRVQLTV